MVVTAIDANHCPGAVMFLFEGYFGKILYTGDFRWSDQMEADLFCCNLGHLDVLYLDNTYCSPKCVFPSREEAKTQILDILNRHKNHDIVIGLRSLGKEDILLTIAEEFKEWISLPGDLYTTAQILGLPNIFCVNETDCSIRVEPFYSISNKNLDKWNETRPTIAIVPTALYIGLEMSPFINREDIYVVPYSDHSSYSELMEFVKFVKPKVIYPIVKENAKGPFGVKVSDRADMSCFSSFLDPELRQVVEIPDSVKEWMALRIRNSPKKRRKNLKRKNSKTLQNKRKKASGVVYHTDSSSSSDTEENAKTKSDEKTLTRSVNTKENRNDSDFEITDSPSILIASYCEKIDSSSEDLTNQIADEDNSPSLQNNLNICTRKLFQEKIGRKTVESEMDKNGDTVHKSVNKRVRVLPLTTKALYVGNNRKAPSVKHVRTLAQNSSKPHGVERGLAAVKQQLSEKNI